VSCAIRFITSICPLKGEGSQFFRLSFMDKSLLYVIFFGFFGLQCFRCFCAF
jgi:hypothetical protein